MNDETNVKKLYSLLAEFKKKIKEKIDETGGTIKGKLTINNSNSGENGLVVTNTGNNKAVVIDKGTAVNTQLEIKDSLRDIWLGTSNGKGTFYLYDATGGHYIICSPIDGTNIFNGTSSNVSTVNVFDSIGHETTVKYKLPKTYRGILFINSYTSMRGQYFLATHSSSGNISNTEVFKVGDFSVVTSGLGDYIMSITNPNTGYTLSPMFIGVNSDSIEIVED